MSKLHNTKKEKFWNGAKVSILTEGGKDIGFGHITRCVSLCEAFEKKGIKPEFIINGDDSISKLLKGKKYRIFNWLKEKERLFNLICDANIGIVDSYLADSELYRKISEIVKVPVYIDDNKRLAFPKGIVVNGAIYAKDIDYVKDRNVTYLLGIQYMPLRREFWNIPRKVIRKKIESIMVTFGGDDKKNMTPRISKFLTDKYPELTKNIIISNGFKKIKKIKDLKDKKTNLIYSPDVKKIKKTMLESDLAISAGGQTLYEFARIGIPPSEYVSQKIN